VADAFGIVVVGLVVCGLVRLFLFGAEDDFKRLHGEMQLVRMEQRAWG
jgi:hypothetical protein